MRILALSTNYKYHQDLLQSLHDKGIITEFATSHKPNTESLNRKFYATHKTKLIDGSAFYRIKDIQKLISPNAPALDKQTLDYFEKVERDFYTLTDRYAYFPKPFRTRKRLFRYGLRFWLDFFAQNKIDAIFSICTPHNFPDYTAYHVAKYLGIKTLHTTDVMLNDHVLLLDDYRQVIKVPEDYLAEKTDEEIIATINPLMAARIFAESNEIVYSRQLNDRTLKTQNMNAKAEVTKSSEKMAKFRKKLGQALISKPLQTRFKSAFAMNGELSNLTRRLIRLESLNRVKKLKAEYEKLSVYPDYTKKFAYLALHLQPERVTQPEGEIFEDQLLALEVLRRSLPDDWLIYVKENPTQYGKKGNLIHGRHYRDATDYIDYLRLPNVQLIRQDVKTADLIGNASLVASLKGSVGWERMATGKPCMIFSNAWYSACRSAYRVYDVPTCKDAITQILAKTPAQVATDKLKFFSYMQDYIIIGNMGGHYNLEIATVPYEELVESLAKNIIKRFGVSTKI